MAFENLGYQQGTTLRWGGFTYKPPVIAPTVNQVLTIVDTQGTMSWTSTGGSGTVTSITAGTGLSGGTITGSGTIAIANTAVTAGTYGDATHVGTFTVNAQGQITAASNVAITGGGTIGGSIAQYQVAIGSGTNTITGGGGLTYNYTTGVFNVTSNFTSITVQNGLITLAPNGGIDINGATYSFPGTIGAAGTVLTDVAGNGTLSWVAGVPAPAALTATQIGYGSVANLLTGDANLTTQNNAGTPYGLAVTDGFGSIFIGTPSAPAGSTTPSGVEGSVAIGGGALSSLQSLSTGGNVAYGINALIANTVGNTNSAFGNGAGATNVTGGGNVFLGYHADVSTDGIFGSVALGNAAVVTASNQFVVASTITTMTLRNIDHTLSNLSPVFGTALTGTSAAPAASVGAAAGVGASVVLGGTNIGGLITLTTGTGGTTGDVVDVIFDTLSYDSSANVVLTPADPNSAVASHAGNAWYVTSSSTGFSINISNTALADGTTYVWAYAAVGY